MIFSTQKKQAAETTCFIEASTTKAPGAHAQNAKVVLPINWRGSPMTKAGEPVPLLET